MGCIAVFGLIAVGWFFAGPLGAIIALIAGMAIAAKSGA